MLEERFEGEILWSSNNRVIFPGRRNHSDLGSRDLATSSYHEPSDMADSGDIQISSIQHFLVPGFKYHPPATRCLKHFRIEKTIMAQGLDGGC